MRNIINYIVIGVLAVISTFYIFCITSYASALPTYDPIPDGWTVLDGEQQHYYEFGVTPEAGVFGFLNAYDHLNQDLYEKYGWDIQDAQIYAQDWLTDDSTLWNSQNSLVSALTGGQITSVSDAIREGYTLFRYTLPSFVNSTSQGLSTWFMGKIVDGTNTISNIYRNTFVPINDNFINSFSEQYQNMVDDEVIDDLTSKNVFYGNNFTFIDNGSQTRIFHIETNYSVYYFWSAETTSATNNKYVDVLAPLSIFDDSTSGWLLFPSNFINSSYVVQGGNTYYPTEARFRQYSDYSIININGTDYAYGRIYLVYNNSYYAIVNTSNMMFRDVFLNWVQSNIIGNNATSYIWSDTDSNGNSINIKDLLEELKGHYVTTEQLEGLIETISDFPVTPVPEPALEPTSEQWDLLESQIETIINEALATDPYFDPNLNPDIDPNPNPNPNPDPEPSPSDINTGIALPESFSSDIIRPFTDVLKLPFSFLSVFEPIFYMFNHSLLFPLWLLIPSIIVVCFIIWALK